MNLPSLILLILLILQTVEAKGAELVIDDYSMGIGANWESKSFKGMTLYSINEDGGRRCIRAQSRASASALYYRLKFDPREYPVIRWGWKIDGIISPGDARKKNGDDYAARVYVVFPSLFFWKTRALNYIWANRLPRGEAVANPFTANAIMIAVQSGNDHSGKWMEERRNILDDFRRYFGSEPPEAGAIAIMTDTDNTGAEASACYGPIKLAGGDGL